MTNDQGDNEDAEGEGEDVAMRNLDDSSEEEEEDEEEERRVRDGFIVDEDEEEEDYDDEEEEEGELACGSVILSLALH